MNQSFSSFVYSIEKLYKKGLSLQEISIRMKCSIHKVVYWMNKNGIKKRSRSEAMYLKLNPNGDPFTIKKFPLQINSFLFGLGIGIYWGEGTKASNNSVRVSNTDPYMIQFFITFLTTICGVKREKIKYSIVCCNDSDPIEVVLYWSNVLQVSKERFGKIVQIPSQGKGTYRRKSKFGVCTVTVCNIKLKQWIMKQIAEIPDAWIV